MTLTASLSKLTLSRSLKSALGVQKLLKKNKTKMWTNNNRTTQDTMPNKNVQFCFCLFSRGLVSDSNYIIVKANVKSEFEKCAWCPEIFEKEILLDVKNSFLNKKVRIFFLTDPPPEDERFPTKEN